MARPIPTKRVRVDLSASSAIDHDSMYGIRAGASEPPGSIREMIATDEMVLSKSTPKRKYLLNEGDEFLISEIARPAPIMRMVSVVRNDPVGVKLVDCMYVGSVAKEWRKVSWSKEWRASNPELSKIARLAVEISLALFLRVKIKIERIGSMSKVAALPDNASARPSGVMIRPRTIAAKNARRGIVRNDPGRVMDLVWKT